MFFYVPSGKSSIGLAGGHKSRQIESQDGQAKRAVEFERLNSDSPWEDCFLTVAVCVGGLDRGGLGSWWIAINKMPRPH